MEKQRIDELIAKYNEGLADPAEIKTIEQLIEAGIVSLTQLRELAFLEDQMMKGYILILKMASLYVTDV